MEQNVSTLFQTLLDRSINRKTHSSVTEWFEYFTAKTAETCLPIDQAILGGRLSQNMSFAFASGYQSAIKALFKPESDLLASFCVTEDLGNHPRAIQTLLTQQEHGWYLNGRKKFITWACEAEILYTACSLGVDEDHRPIIKMLALPARQQGVYIKAMPPLPFIPDVVHGSAYFSQVKIFNDQILASDGYSRYIKPFRTLEDVHVLAAILGYCLGEIVDLKSQSALVEQILPILLALRSLSQLPTNDPTAHLALAGCRIQTKDVIRQMDIQLELHKPDIYKDWIRDKALLGIADKSHQQRTQKAWERIDEITA